MAAGINVSSWQPAFGSVSGLLCIDGSNGFAWLTPRGEEVDDDNVILLKGFLELFVSVVLLVNARTWVDASGTYVLTLCTMMVVACMNESGRRWIVRLLTNDVRRKLYCNFAFMRDYSTRKPSQMKVMKVEMSREGNDYT